MELSSCCYGALTDRPPGQLPTCLPSSFVAYSVTREKT